MNTDKIGSLMQEGSWDLSLGVPGSIYLSNTQLFKTLMTNCCTHACKYCLNSCQNRKRYSYEPEELASVFLHLVSAGQVSGLFLSSGIAGEPDAIMEKMVDSIELIRRAGFGGYVHLKVLPGSSREMVIRAAEVADRLSVNMEVPSQTYLDELGTGKSLADIVRIQEWIAEQNPKAGQSTQFVVGAAGESDLEILEAVKEAYSKRNVKRAYFSSFVPQTGTALHKRDATPLSRVRRLYSVDFIMRQYGIPLREFKDIMEDGNLPPGDPKLHLALSRFDRPLDVDEAEFEDLVRVPGISPKAAYCIEALRDLNLKLSNKILEASGVSLKRASPFLKINGHSQKRLGDFGRPQAGEAVK